MNDNFEYKTIFNMRFELRMGGVDNIQKYSDESVVKMYNEMFGNGKTYAGIDKNALHVHYYKTENKKKPSGQTASVFPTKDEIIKTLYQCAIIEKTNEGTEMKRVFADEADAILKLFKGCDSLFTKDNLFESFVAGDTEGMRTDNDANREEFQNGLICGLTPN